MHKINLLKWICRKCYTKWYQTCVDPCCKSLGKYSGSVSFKLPGIHRGVYSEYQALSLTTNTNHWHESICTCTHMQLDSVLHAADEGLCGRNILQSVVNWYCYVIVQDQFVYIHILCALRDTLHHTHKHVEWAIHSYTTVYICNIHSTVGRSIADICSPRLDIEAMDRPTMLHRIYCMVSVQQVNLSECEVQKTSVSTPFSAQVYLTYMGLRRNA